VADPEFLRIGVHGAAGKMGRHVCRLVAEDPTLQFWGAMVTADDPALNHDVGLIAGVDHIGVEATAFMPSNVQVVIDFSNPDASLSIAQDCADRRFPLVVATTGFTTEQRRTLEGHAEKIPLLIAANCSLVVNVLMKLTETAGRLLANRDFDIEIIERHHRFKLDAPSGTALAFARILQSTMGLDVQRHGREGITGVRSTNEIGLHAVRAGDNVGEHTIIFSTLGETMELVHKGTSRDSYAKGAIAAAKFLVGKPPGLYSMRDVLGIE
jgi:4-hydroxy-tetrahydrodipicolinate reductase